MQSAFPIMYFALAEWFMTECKVLSPWCTLHRRIFMPNANSILRNAVCIADACELPNVKCILRDALYIGVFLGASIFGHVEKAFLESEFLFLASAWKSRFCLADLNCEFASWHAQCDQFSKANICQWTCCRMPQVRVAAQHLQINFWKKYFWKNYSGQRNFWRPRSANECISQSTFLVRNASPNGSAGAPPENNRGGMLAAETSRRFFLEEVLWTCIWESAVQVFGPRIFAAFAIPQHRCFCRLSPSFWRHTLKKRSRICSKKSSKPNERIKLANLQTTSKRPRKDRREIRSNAKSDVRLQHKCVALHWTPSELRLRMWNRIRNELEETVAPRRT